MDSMDTISPLLYALNRVLCETTSLLQEPADLDQLFQTALCEGTSKHDTSPPPQGRVVTLPIGGKRHERASELPPTFAITPIRRFQIHTPRTEEIIHGWRGRMRVINGLSNTKKVEKAIHEEAQRQAPKLSPSADIIECSAVLLQMERNTLEENHTLLPFFNALEDLKPNRPGTQSKRHREAYDRFASLRIEGTRPKFCPHCVQRDLAHNSPPVWQRAPQLPGMLWCLEHKTPLLQANSLDALSSGPDRIDGAQAEDRVEQLTPTQIEILHRYAILANELLLQAPVIDSVAASTILGDWARSKGLRFCKPGNRTTVSSFVMACLPGWWLEETFPRVKWLKDKYIGTIDGACSPNTTRYTSATLCLLAAVLCESTEDAMAVLWARRKEAENRPGRDFWASRAAFDLYVKHKGKVSHVAQELGLPNSSVAIGFLKQGLPGLGKSAEAVSATHRLLKAGRIGELYSHTNDIPIEVERMLRAASSRFTNALDAIEATVKQAPSPFPRKTDFELPVESTCSSEAQAVSGRI